MYEPPDSTLKFLCSAYRVYVLFLLLYSGALNIVNKVQASESKTCRILLYVLTKYPDM